MHSDGRSQTVANCQITIIGMSIPWPMSVIIARSLGFPATAYRAAFQSCEIYFLWARRDLGDCFVTSLGLV